MVRISVEGDKTAEASLASSSVIMPVSTSQSMCLPSSGHLNLSGLPAPYSKVPTVARSSAPSATDDESAAADDDDVVSIHSSTSSYIDVDEFTTTSGSVAPTEDRERDEFDFVDEDEDDMTADELEA
jgi:hypothetical protein